MIQNLKRESYKPIDMLIHVLGGVSGVIFFFILKSQNISSDAVVLLIISGGLGLITTGLEIGRRSLMLKILRRTFSFICLILTLLLSLTVFGGGLGGV
jgi:hypothetical protein